MIAELWAKRIKEGRATIEEVPGRLRKRVEALLKE